jgi:hypothetical protein
MRLILIATIVLGGLSSTAGAQTTGEVSSTSLTGGQATLTLDFSSVDYELILYAGNFAEADTSRSYDYEILGMAANKVIPLTTRQVAAAPSPHDQLARLLRAEEQALSAIPAELRTRPVQKQATPAIGSSRSFTFTELGNVTSDRTITATLVALNNDALAYLDTVPSDSADVVTTDEIQAIIDRFSSSSLSTVNTTFGGPSDIDGDGKLLFLFTPVVDEVGGFGGFFRSASLFETNVGGDGNLADMMYISPTQGADFYDPLLAHEYQHLVNFNQHVLVNDGSGEESWLNEALSYFTEDLIGGHVEGGNRGLLEAFLGAPESFRLNGDAFASSGIRGAAYLSLQTMIDLHGAGVPNSLVATNQTGVQNIEAVTGASFDNLLEAFFTRNFLSATGLNGDPLQTYGSDFLTDSTTGGRVMPHVMDRQIALPSTAVSGQVRPAAAAYFRLTAEAGTHDVIINGDLDADLVALVIPIERNFQVHNVLPTDYLPQLTLDAPLIGNLTTGQTVIVEGTLANTSDTEILFSFNPIDGGQDTLRFESSVENGRFKSILIASHDQAGTYELNIFSGMDDQLLPFVGKLPSVVVSQGEGPINLPPDFFRNIAFDTDVPTSATTGETLRLTGSVSDPEVTQMLIKLVDAAGQAIDFTANVESGLFEMDILFGQDQAGPYSGEIFMGVAGQSLPFVGRFPSFVVTEGEGGFSLPSDFFDGIVLDSGFPTLIQAGQGFSLQGTTTDPTIEILLFVLTDGVGTETRFQFNVVDGAFRKGLVFFPSQVGEHTLNVFGGPSGGSLPGRGSFSPVTIESSGTASVILPIDIFSGMLLDAPLPADFFDGQTRTISGVLTDTSVDQLAIRFDAIDGTVGPSEFASVTDGQFSVTAPTATLTTGEYEILFFAGLSGAGLPFIDRFGPVSILSSQPRITLSTESLSFEQTEIGSVTTLTLTLENTGSETLSLSEAGIDSGPYTVSPNTFGVQAGATVSLAVSFTPIEEGTASGVLQIVSNDPTRPTVTINLIGTAPPPPAAVPIPILDSQDLSWGNVTLGTPTTLTLSLENGGAAPLIVDSLRVEGAFAFTPFQGSVEPGGTITFELIFDPQEPGSATGTLTIFTADSPTPLTVSLAATGTEASEQTADINGDGNVGFADFLELAGAFGKSEGQEGYVAAADINGDKTVGFADFLILAAQFGT